MNPDYRIYQFNGINELGVFKKDEWVSEGESLNKSSKALNELSQSSKSELDFLVSQRKEGRNNSNSKNIVDLIKTVESYKKSSILLLGYSIEMYLKAGLVCLHQHTARDNFVELLRKKYSHNLSKVAQLLGIPLSGEEIASLDRLKDLVLDEARYPITPLSEVDYINQVNKLNQKIWSVDQYQDWVELASKISDSVRKIDSDSSNPVSFSRYEINDDGYCVFRFGGNLPAYLLTKYSTEQKDNGSNNSEDLIELLIENLPESITRSVISQHPDDIRVVNLGKRNW
ncbi:MAG: hypothetical protein KUG81_08545 [Gammaproteobacteria bacterium]|nr:hypothetical protein [Gammaproteobacteria bacterium]